MVASGECARTASNSRLVPLTFRFSGGSLRSVQSWARCTKALSGWAGSFTSSASSVQLANPSGLTTKFRDLVVPSFRKPCEHLADIPACAGYCDEALVTHHARPPQSR